MKMSINKKRKKFLKVGVVMFIIFVLFGAVKIFKGTLEKRYNRSWNEEKVIKTSAQKPKQNIYTSYGCLPEEKICKFETNTYEWDTFNYQYTKVIVYVEKDKFIARFQQETNNFIKNNHEKKESQKALSALDVFINDLEIEYKNNDSVEINIFYEKFVKNHPDLETSAEFNFPLRETLLSMLQGGEVAVFDLENSKFTETINYVDKGFLCGPLCGSGYTYFSLPNGKIFIYSSWIS